MKNEEKEQEKTKKPIYKKWWFIAIIVVVILFIIVGRDEKVKWSSLGLGEYLPEPTKGQVKVGSDLEDYLALTIKDVKNSYYEKYSDLCIDKGYTIESRKTGSRYEAFNSEGYELSISYSSDDIHITLKAPEKMENINWPTTGLGSMLPIPNSTKGKINSESSSSFRVHIGNMTMEDFNKYIEECKNKGFSEDFNKQEDRYYAKDYKGYRLSLQYLGFNVVDILIQEPENNANKPNVNTGDIRKEFKEAMDSYEKFIDEYVVFMKKYKASNGTDLSLISDYSKYMTKYAEMMEKFEKWESSDMNTKEAAYYLEVQTRVTKKLLEVAN